jgi:Sporulation and spore germination
MTSEETLREILNAEAESVDVAPDALDVIRGRIARRRVRWWRSWRPSGLAILTFTGGTAVVAAAAVAVALATAPSVQRAPQAPAGPSGAVQLPPAANLPVYYLGDTSVGVRLFREYHLVHTDGTDAAARTRAALRTMLTTNSPADPDYRTPWGDAAVDSVRIDGDTVSVGLRGVPQSAPPDPRMAVQQLIWTATAVSGATAVRLTVDGRTVPSLWGYGGMDQRLVRDARTDVQAPVWLIDPQQGTQVGTTFAVYVAATAPGGTVRLRVTPAGGGAPISDNPVSLSAAAPQLGEAHTSLTLSPGRYTVTAYLPGPTGGPGPDADSHEITIG